ncbi:MAG: hypothetical protein LPK00_14030 [Bacillaceae bacterium]|nr:hypothetical protein [Bacillaceae bacterium]
MNKVLVLGEFNFISLSLCKRLVEREFDVVSIEMGSEIRNDAENMIMEIGRNAFFTFKKMESFEQIKRETEIKAAFVFPNKEMLDNDFQKRMKEMSHSYEFVYIIQRGDLHEPEWLRSLDSFENVTIIQLNEVFGPWQSEKDTIQRVIFNKIKGKKEANGENDKLEEKDYLYVEDVTSIFLSLLEKKEAIPHKFLYVTNPNENVSVELAEELSLKLNKECSFSAKRKGVSVWDYIDIKPTYTVKEALEEHILHSKMRLKRS